MTDPRLIHHVDQLRAAIVEVAAKWLHLWAWKHDVPGEEIEAALDDLERHIVDVPLFGEDHEKT